VANSLDTRPDATLRNCGGPQLRPEPRARLMQPFIHFVLSNSRKPPQILPLSGMDDARSISDHPPIEPNLREPAEP